jgi:hypothetical protein
MKKNYALFTKLITFIISLMQIAKMPKPTNLLSTYTSINDTPLDVFIDCLIDGKLERLIKTGNCEYEKLKNIFEDIFTEHCEKTNTQKFKEHFELTREAGILHSQILIINTCISALSLCYNENLVKVLKSIGFDYEFKEGSLIEDLKSVLRIKKAYDIELEMLNAKMAKLNENDFKITREYFDKLLISLWKWKGGEIIRASQITVNEFDTLCNVYFEEIKLKNS